MTMQSIESALRHGMAILAYVLHIGGGTIDLASGLLAAAARTGGTLHRRAGTVFLLSMLGVATWAAYLAVTVPGQIVNLFIATFTWYLVATAWTTVRRHEGTIGRSDQIALLVAVCLCAPFATLAI